jgi:hypothetical protein
MGMKNLDHSCPVCKNPVTPLAAIGFPEKCEHCGKLLRRVRVIGDGVVFEYYRKNS